MPGFGFGSGFLRGRRQGLGIANVVLPFISGTLADGNVLSCMPGVWSRGIPIRQWCRDGVPISGATGLTYTYVAATDDGCYLAVVETNGAVTATSNALIGAPYLTTYSTTFAGTDGTDLNGYDGWTGLSGIAKISGNDLQQVAAGTSNFYHNAASNDHAVSLKYISGAVPEGTVNTLRVINARTADANNKCQITMQSNGYSVNRIVSGTTTTLQSFVGRTFVTGDVVTLEVSGNYAKVYINGTLTPQSAAANGGLGYDVSAVPSAAKVSIAFTASAGSASYPFKVADSVAIDAIAANRVLVASAAVEDVSGVIGQQRLRLTGVVSGAITQLQVMLAAPSGAILADWANVSGLSGITFNSVTANLPQTAEGQTIRVWVRDAVNKSAVSSITVAVPVAAQQVNSTFGINTSVGQYGRYYSDDLMKMAMLYVKRAGSYRNPWSSLTTDVMNASTNPSYVPASDIGVASNGFPTKFPNDVSGYSTDPTVDYPFYYFNFTNGVPVEIAGTYDVTFTPGLRWSLSGGGTVMQRTAYNEVAGTATIVLTTGATGFAPEIKFQGYNAGSGYVAGVMPPAGVGFLRAVKSGADGKRFMSAAKSSVAGLVSKNANRGYIRCMDDLQTNRQALVGLSPHGERTTRRAADFIGQFGNTEKCSMEDILEIAVDTQSNVWLNIPDNATPEYIADVAAFWRDNLPAGYKLAVEYSNECWNTTAGFMQQATLNVSVPNFTSGSVAVNPGDYIKGATSGLVRRVGTQVINIGAIGAGTAAGYFVLRGGFLSGAFTAGEALHLCDAAGNVITSNIAVYDSTDSSQPVRYARRCAWAFDLFEATFGSGDPRLEFVMAWQSGSTYAFIQSMLDERNLWQRVKKFAIAPYVGGGQGGDNNDLGNYSKVGVFTKAQRDVIDPAGANDPVLFKNNAFSALSTMSSASETVWRTFVTNLARYCVSKGMSRTAIRPATYEHMWQHIIEGNTPTGQAAATKAAFAQMLRDARAGTQQVAQNSWLKNTGGDFVAFAHLSPAGTSLSQFGSWGFCDYVGTENQEPYASSAAWIAANT